MYHGLSVTVAALSVVTPSVAPNALQASVCDEQIESIGGEIALTGNKKSNTYTFLKQIYHGGENDYLNNSKIILICNRTNTKLPGKLNSFRVGNGNFENSKLFGGPVILKKNTQLSCFFSLLVFSLIFSCLPSSVLSLLLLWPLLSSLILSCLFSSCLSFSVSLCLSLSLSVSVSLSLSPCGGVCCACWCGVVFGVWCGTQKKNYVCRFKTSPCVPAPRAHVSKHSVHSTAQHSTAHDSTSQRNPPLLLSIISACHRASRKKKKSQN